MEIREKVKLADYTTFKVGGDAGYFTIVRSEEDAKEAVNFAKQKKIPIFILGGGSNIVVSDDGFQGLVIKNEIKGLEVKGDYMEAGGGENWDELVKVAVEMDLQGIECLSGIPGSFGGAVVQNVGAYGQTLADRIDSVEALDTESGQIKFLGKRECLFAYRTSLFKQNPGKYIVTKATMKLYPNRQPTLAFPAVERFFADNPNPTLLDVRKAVIEIRAGKGMVISAMHESYKSAGSFFTNPVISREDFDKIFTMIKCPDNWYWLDESGLLVKVAAACLITQAGFAKGQMIGQAQVSPKQPLAIINPGKATAADIKSAAETIKAAVRDKFGVELTEEIIYVG